MVLLEFVTYSPQEFAALRDFIVDFYSFAFQPVYYADDASSLAGFSDQNFQRISRGCVNCAYFGDFLDFVEDIKRIGVLYKYQETVATTNFKRFLRRQPP